MTAFVRDCGVSVRCEAKWIAADKPTYEDSTGNAHATILANSSLQKSPPCGPTRSFITTSAPALWSALAHVLALSRKKGSCVPATR